MDGGRSPTLAALLSFLLPGLGQAYAGRPARALLFLLPALAAWLIVIAALASGRLAVLGYLVQPAVLNALLLLNVALFLFHAAAVIDAYSLARRNRAPRRPRAPVTGSGALAALALLLVATFAVHAVPEYYGYSLAVNLPRFLNTGGSNGIPTPSWELSPSPGAATPSAGSTGSPGPTVTPTGQSGPTASPSASPSPTIGTGWAADGRLNVLLLGSDAGPGRWGARPDAVLLLSVDVASARSAVFAFPRYMNNLPVPPETAHMFKDGRYPGFLNAIYTASLNNPRRFPYNDEAGWGVMAGVVQELSGVKVDGYMVVNLAGFEQIVDALGGMSIQVPPPGVVDSRYGLGTGRRVSLRVDAGCQQLNGRRALFFSRSRHQDGDIARLHRQLVTIQSFGRNFDPLAVLPRLPELLSAAGDNAHLSFGPDDFPALAELAARVDPNRMSKTVFSAPDYPRALPADTVARIQAKVGGIFDEDEPPAERVDCPPG